MLNNEKVLIIKSEILEDACYDYEEDAREEIIIDTHSEIYTVIEALMKDICSPAGMNALLKDESFKTALMQNGWMDEQTAKDFGNFKGKNHFYASLGYHFDEVDVTCPSSHSIRQLADKKCLLLQEVDKNCLKEAAPELYGKITLRKKQLSAEAKKKADKKAEKSAQSKKKALDKARKLLEAAGELPK